MLIFTLANDRQRRQIQHQDGPIEFGRLPQGNCAKVVVDDPFTSRDQLRITELPGGEVRIENLGGPVTLPDGARLAPRQSRQFTPPLRVAFGRTTLEISAIPREDATDASLKTIARPVGSETLKPVLEPGRMPTAHTLASWFEALLRVQRAAAGSDEFYADTARAVVELVGLDRGLVLLRRGEDWETIAAHAAAGEQVPYSRRVLQRVLADRRTFYQSFGESGAAQSLTGIEAVVASPIFDERDEVIGVVYGSRDMRTAATGRLGIDPLEAQFVQLLAAAVSSGLARVAREAEAARARVLFEQFFSAELAQALQRDPQMLSAQERELSLLFADLRGFSRIAERIGARQTFELLSDILDRLTNQIMDHGGVVIDYYGDGLAAMWNAPADLPQHADRAVAAAMALLGELPAVNSTWAEKLGGLVRLGIGLHTGVAQIGNSGSKRRLKYGPRGHAVNLTSRVEAATKLFGVPCLMTGAMKSALALPIPLRRIGRARLTGMAEPVELWEARPESYLTWKVQSERYEAALGLYEQGRAADCVAACQALQRDFGAADGPTNWLLRQAQQQAAAGRLEYDPVFTVETK